jgi:hypothetical protein
VFLPYIFHWATETQENTVKTGVHGVAAGAVYKSDKVPLPQLAIIGEAHAILHWFGRISTANSCLHY